MLFDAKQGVSVPVHKRRIGYVFARLFPHMTVRKNLDYGRRMNRVKVDPNEERRILTMLNIADLVDRMPGNLSGGEKQRVSAKSLKTLHKAQDYKGMVQLIKKAMNIEDITFQVFWVSEGATQQQKNRSSPAWVELPEFPDELPFYGTAAFKQKSLKMFFRKSFLAGSSYDQVAIVIAHELSHVVLDSIRHPLKRVEKAVDLTAMLLGFRRLYISGAHKSEWVSNSIRTIGYLSAAEVQMANKCIEVSQKESKIRASESTGERARLSNLELLGILLFSVVLAFVLGWGLGRHSM